MISNHPYKPIYPPANTAEVYKEIERRKWLRKAIRGVIATKTTSAARVKLIAN